MKRISLYGALAFILCVSSSAAWAGSRAPYVPSSSDVVLQSVPSSTDPRVRHFQQLRTRALRYPNDMKQALNLARAYINYGRSTGDARFLGRAMAVIDPWMQHKPVAIPVVVVHATILQSRHYFKAARNELQGLLKRDPNNLQAWLTLATVAMVQGDYALANTSCVHVASVGGDFMGLTCSASLRALTGHGEQAYKLFALVQHPGPEAPPAIRAWVQGLMADTAKRLGDIKAANTHYRKALQLTPGDNFLLADYADFLLDQGRPKAAAELVKGYTQSDTSFMRLVFAKEALGSPDVQHAIDEMNARFIAMDRRGSHVYRREQARFVLYLEHNPQRALELARKNWTVQRAPKDMRIYLEAALAANQPKAARPVLALLATSHLQDPAVNRLARRVRAALSATADVSHKSDPRS